MYKQLEYLRENVTMVRNQTYRIDLPESGLLSGIWMKITGACVSGATLADPLWRIQDHVNLVEVIGNGGTVIKSVQFKHLDYFNWLKHKVSPIHAWRNYATNNEFEYVPILFGRKLGDVEYGLDLGRWDNVELRITNAATATYYGADFTISLLLEYIRESPAGFKGFLRSETWREWTTVADATQYFTLPVEYPISGVYLRAVPHKTLGIADTGFANLMDDVVFALEGGVKRVYTGGLDDLALINYLEDGAESFVGGLIDITADRGVEVSQGRSLGHAMAITSKDGAGAAVIATIESDLTDGTIKPETREADNPIEFLFHGYAYQFMGHLWHSETLEPDTLLVPASVGDIKLNIHTQNAAAAAGGLNQVVLERIVV